MGDTAHAALPVVEVVDVEVVVDGLDGEEAHALTAAPMPAPNTARISRRCSFFGFFTAMAVRYKKFLAKPCEKYGVCVTGPPAS